MNKSLTAALALVVSCFVTGCHTPERFTGSAGGGVTGPTVTADGTLYSINGAIQVCNASASQDPVNYPGCMSFLNFQGKQLFKVNPLLTPGIDTAQPDTQHDHLYIVDKNDTLRWAFSRNALSPDRTLKMQDPEWSADGRYMAFVFGNVSWDGYAVRISDKRAVRLCAGNLTETADIHLWAGTAKNDTLPGLGHTHAAFAVRDTVAAVFGDSVDVKVVYVLYNMELGSRSIYVADWHMGQALPDTFSLPKPTACADWDPQNPIISPDGCWVAYSLVSSDGQTFKPFVQQLIPDAVPNAAAASGSDPHFFYRSGGQEKYIVYSTRGGNIEGAYESMGASSLGQTLAKKVELSASDAEAWRFRLSSDAPAVLAPYPMKGGITPDGGFLATGYSRAYLWQILAIR